MLQVQEGGYYYIVKMSIVSGVPSDDFNCMHVCRIPQGRREIPLACKGCLSKCSRWRVLQHEGLLDGFD